MNQPLKTMKVEMLVHVYSNGDCIKKWEHHIDYAIDMDSYPEINGISDVKVNDITESSNYYLEDDVVCTDNTAYGMLNDILRCKEIKDEATVRELTKNYYVSSQIVKKVFDII